MASFDKVPLHHILAEEKNKIITGYKSRTSTSSSTETTAINFARAAVLTDDKSTLKKILDNELDILNSADALGRTLLIYAASSNKLRILKLLLKRGSSVDICDRSGRSALHWAIHWDNVEIVKTLLQHNADCLLADVEGVSPIHEAVKLSSPKCLRILIDAVYKKCPDSDSLVTDNYGRSVVHWAAMYCRVEHLHLLVKVPQLCSVIDQRDLEGRTPLMLAASSVSESSLVCCQVLAQKAPWIVKAQDKSGLSALHHGCMSNNAIVVAWLLESSLMDPDSSLDNNYQTALHWACKSNALECVDILLKHGADLQIDKTGCSPLHYVARQNLDILVERLLLRFRRDNIADGSGKTALMHAVMSGANNVVEIIFRLVEVDKNQKDYEGRSLLHLAARCGQCQTLQILLKHSLQLEAVDIHGLSPFLSAVECGQVRCVQILLKAGADSSRCDRHGRTALHWATLGGHAYLCQLLIKHGLNPDYADCGGRTPLHCAAFAGHSDCASILLQSGAATIWTPDNDGYSVLHTAAEQGYVKTAKILIEDGGLAVNTVCTIDDQERTPLDLALAAKKLEMVDYLVTFGGLTYEALANAAATKIQSLYRSFQVRKMLRPLCKPNCDSNLAAE